mgnify:CR=1 FL=1
MKIINKENIDNEILKRFHTSTKNTSPNKLIYDDIAKLEIGDALSIEKNEWIGYTPPSTAVHGITRLRGRGKKYPEHTYALSKLGRNFIGKSFSVKRFEDGWMIVRKQDKLYRSKYLQLLKIYDEFLEEHSKSGESINYLNIIKEEN